MKKSELSKNNQPYKYDAIIVLANLMDADGNLNEESRSRLDTAIKAYHEGEAPVFMTCGWPYREDSKIAIADSMSKYAAYCGIPSRAIVTEKNSRDTVGDAVFTKRNHAIARGWTNLLVVTSSYHVERTKEIFTFIYGPRYQIDVRGAPSLDTEDLRNLEQKSIKTFRSTFSEISPGEDGKIIERLAERHPFYNGVIYKKI